MEPWRIALIVVLSVLVLNFIAAVCIKCSRDGGGGGGQGTREGGSGGGGGGVG